MKIINTLDELEKLEPGTLLVNHDPAILPVFREDAGWFAPRIPMPISITEDDFPFAVVWPQQVTSEMLAKYQAKVGCNTVGCASCRVDLWGVMGFGEVVVDQ